MDDDGSAAFESFFAGASALPLADQSGESGASGGRGEND
jgi:hypothetical protein